jgi:hypothetical protein
MLDQEDKMLLDRINHLASDLSAEMKEAVQVGWLVMCGV